MENEIKQLASVPEIVVSNHTKEDSVVLEVKLDMNQSVHQDVKNPEGISDVVLNIDSQPESAPKILVAPDSKEDCNKSNKSDEGAQVVPKHDKAMSRRDTAETLELEVVGTAVSTSDLTQGLRTRFIRKVLFILLSQLVLTSLMVGMVFIPNTGYKTGIQNNPVIALITVIISLMSFMFLICARKYLKKVPWNYILLFTFTCSISYSLAYLASFTKSTIVLIAAIFTLIIVLGATIFAWKSKSNSSKMGYFLYQIIPLTVGLIIAGIVFPSHILQAAISAGIALIFSVHLTYDIHRLIGKFEVKYTVDDYILAALDIYIDIYVIFVEMLKLVQSLVQN